MSDTDNSRNHEQKKKFKQKIASDTDASESSKRSKEESLTKSAETRLKIILGAEVAKAFGCKVEDIDKEFVLGILIHFQNVGAEDKARLKLRGKIFLENMVARK